MLRPRTMQLARLCGVRVGAAPSWFVVLGLTIVLLWQAFGDWVPNAGSSTVYVLAVAAAFGFAASIALHELGHALAARSCGIEVIGVDLWLLGGLTHLGRDTQSPGEEFRVASAGPVVNAVIVGLLIAAQQTLAPEATVSQLLGAEATDEPLVALCGWLLLVNGGLLAFNLLPGYPLDGGRLLQAAAWKATGNRGAATRVSGAAGRVLGFAVIAFGLWLLWQQETLAGISTLLLGWFLAQGARGAMAAGSFTERLDGVTAADVMDRSAATIHAGSTASDALEDLGRREPAPTAMPVLDAAGHLLGLLSLDRLQHALHDGRPLLTAAELLDEHSERILGDTPLQEVLRSERLRDHGVVPVVDENGMFQGLVTIERVRRALATGR